MAFIRCGELGMLNVRFLTILACNTCHMENARMVDSQKVGGTRRRGSIYIFRDSSPLELHFR